jgi:hypothetical protein
LVYRCLHDIAQRITQGKFDVGATPWSTKIIHGKIRGTGNDGNPMYMGYAVDSPSISGGDFSHSVSLSFAVPETPWEF